MAMESNFSDPTKRPIVAIAMGSESDYAIMQLACKTLTDFAVPFQERILSAHRTPERLREFAQTAEQMGIQIIIAGAGGAAHLPGMLAAFSNLPVLGVPIPTPALEGLDSLLSIVQMPKGVPVASFAIGASGAINAALFAVSMLARQDVRLQTAWQEFRKTQTAEVKLMPNQTLPGNQTTQ